LGFFEDRLYGLVEELGKAGVGGHRKKEIGEEGSVEDAGAVFGKRYDEQDENRGREASVEKSFSNHDAFAAPAPCELGRAVGRRGASRWWQAARFFRDLEDYAIQRNSVDHHQFWQKMGKWLF
jgi:hypothetical protein